MASYVRGLFVVVATVVVGFSLPIPSTLDGSAAQTKSKTVSPKQLSNLPVYKVVRVIDGDTVLVSIDRKTVRVRLIGVDTPETVDPRRPVQYFGREASQFTKKLLTGKKVKILYDQNRTDRYGRTLGYLFRADDHLFVNEQIILQGYGHAYTRYPFRHLERFRKAEREARKAKRGLWAEKRKSKTPEAGTETKVYVTRTGRKSHRAGCRYLGHSKREISLKAACQGYGRCSVCRPPVLAKKR